MCSGIGAPETALPEWDWLWCAEVEAAPSAVLAARFPHSVNLGDLEADDFVERAVAVGIPDVLIAGTPCQDFSIAGLRAGLKGERGNLTMRALQIWEGLCRAAKFSGLPAPIFWWENVPGVLSDKTNAFGNLLGFLSGGDTALVPGKGQQWTYSGVVDGPGGSVAWRTLDAQYFGLAQRRARVFVIGCADGRACPAEILLEFDGVRRDFAPCRGEGQEIAGTFSARTEGGGDSGLISSALEVSRSAAYSVALRGREGGATAELGDEVAGALRASRGGGDKPHVLAFGGNNTSGPIDVSTAMGAKGGSGHGDFESETFIVTGTLCGNGKAAGSATQQDAETGMLVGQSRAQHGIAFKASHFTRGKDGAPSDLAPPLSADADKGDQDTLVLAFDSRQDCISNRHITEAISSSLPQSQAVVFTQNTRDEVRLIGGDGGIAGALAAETGAKQQTYIMNEMIVRRLMPIETERLQGFPDGHTDVALRGQPMKDGPRYKCVGNSMAVDVIRWQGKRLEKALGG
jgi:DNA (cytosine-5)-methyltransferase 1